MIEQSPEPGGAPPPGARTNLIHVATFVLVLLNSLALAYGYRMLDRAAYALSWIAGTAVAYQAQPDPVDLRPTVDVYYSFSCEACRSSAAALAAAAAEYTDRVRFRYHFISTGPERDPLGFRAAKLASCAPDISSDLILGLAEELSENTLARVQRELNIPADGLSDCMRSPGSAAKVWQESLIAKARGVNGTPTLHIAGMSLTSVVDYDDLVSLIEQSFRVPDAVSVE